MYSLWNLCSVVSGQLVTWQISLNNWSQKDIIIIIIIATTTKLKKTFLSLQIGSEPGYSSMLSQAVYNPTLAFTSFWDRAQRSARGVSLGFSHIFSEHASSPGNMHYTLDSPAYVIPLQSPYSYKNLPPQSPPSQAFGSVYHILHPPSLAPGDYG